MAGELVHRCHWWLGADHPYNKGGDLLYRQEMASEGAGKLVFFTGGPGFVSVALKCSDDQVVFNALAFWSGAPEFFWNTATKSPTAQSLGGHADTYRDYQLIPVSNSNEIFALRARMRPWDKNGSQLKIFVTALHDDDQYLSHGITKQPEMSIIASQAAGRTFVNHNFLPSYRHRPLDSNGVEFVGAPDIPTTSDASFVLNFNGRGELVSLS